MKKVRKQRPVKKGAQYIAALEAENARLHARIAKLEVQERSNWNRMKALKKEFEENRPPAPTITIARGHQPTEAEIVERAKALGYRVEKT